MTYIVWNLIKGEITMGDILNDSKCKRCAGNMICDRKLRSGMPDCCNFSYTIKKLLNPKSKVDVIRDRIREEFGYVAELDKDESDIDIAMMHVDDLIKAVREENESDRPNCDACFGEG